MARQFVDTNVVVYAFDTSAGAKHERASTLLEDLVVAGDAAVSVQVLQELFVTLTRKLPKPLPVDEAAAIVDDLSVVTVHAPQAPDVLAGIDLSRRHRVTFWDAMVLRSAVATGCEVLWSEDLSAGQAYDGVTVRNPFSS